MIIDTLANAECYCRLGDRLAEGLQFLAQTDLSSLALGRHDIHGDECFALVSEYETKPLDQAVWEAHRRYIDIQCLASGREQIGYAALDSLTTDTEYDASKDAEFLKGSGDFLTLVPGTFAVFYPQDAHMPGLDSGSRSHVRKIVIKVLAE